MNWEVPIVPLGEKHQPQKWTDGGAPQQKSQLLSSLLAVVLTHGELGPSVWTQCGSAFPEPPVYTVQWHLSCLQNRDGYKSCCKVQWVVTASQSWWCARGKGCAPPAALKDGRNIPSSSHFHIITDACDASEAAAGSGQGAASRFPVSPLSCSAASVPWPVEFVAQEQAQCARAAAHNG